MANLKTAKAKVVKVRTVRDRARNKARLAQAGERKVKVNLDRVKANRVNPGKVKANKVKVNLDRVKANRVNPGKVKANKVRVNRRKVNLNLIKINKAQMEARRRHYAGGRARRLQIY